MIEEFRIKWVKGFENFAKWVHEQPRLIGSLILGILLMVMLVSAVSTAAVALVLFLYLIVNHPVAFLGLFVFVFCWRVAYETMEEE